MARIYKSKGQTKTVITFLLIIVLAVFVIYCIWYAADSLKRTQDEEALLATENAIVRASVQCYALEGQFPTGLAQLEENYGLTLNRDKYIYHFESIGANMVPVVSVYPRT